MPRNNEVESDVDTNPIQTVFEKQQSYQLEAHDYGRQHLSEEAAFVAQGNETERSCPVL